MLNTKEPFRDKVMIEVLLNFFQLLFYNHIHIHKIDVLDILINIQEYLHLHLMIPMARKK
jgi:hypothetical protein